MDAGEQGVHLGDCLLSLPLIAISLGKAMLGKADYLFGGFGYPPGCNGHGSAYFPFTGLWFWISDSGAFPPHLCFADP